MAGRSRANHAAGEVDTSWQVWGRCRICKRRICVNNYADRKVRPPRKNGVVCCPWCSWEASYLWVMAKAIAKSKDKQEIKALRRQLRRFFESEAKVQDRLARRGPRKAV